jgi:hypothetical protein
LAGDAVTILNYTSSIAALPTSRNVQDFTATAAQTTFTVTNGYIVGLIDVFVNGSKLTSSEFTATNGTTFVLTVASTVGDQVQSINYTASVNGISGAGTVNYVPKFTASGTIGNSAITDDGTTVTLVSRLLNGTQATFTSTANTYAGSALILKQLGGTNPIYLTSVSGNFALSNGGSTDHLLIASTGAATFSNSVTLSNSLQISNTVNAYAYQNFGAGATYGWQIGKADNSASLAPSNGFYIYDIAGAATRMAISQAGNIGFGTVAPSVFFQITKNANASNIARIENTTSGTAAYSALQLASSGQVYLYNFSNAYTTSGKFAAGTFLIDVSNTNGININTSQGAPILFSTTDAERMRITSGGDAFFGTTSNTGNATGGSTNVGVIIEGANGAITTQRNNSANIFCSKASGFTDGTLIHFFTQGINRGSITTNGVNTAYNTSSDYRLKEDLKEYNGLNIISKLKTYDFKWKDTNIRDYGVMAHELQEVLPNYVNGDKDAINDDGTIKTQGVDYSKIVPVLVKAIQEQQSQIEELKTLLKAK